MFYLSNIFEIKGYFSLLSTLAIVLYLTWSPVPCRSLRESSVPAWGQRKSFVLFLSSDSIFLFLEQHMTDTSASKQMGNFSDNSANRRQVQGFLAMESLRDLLLLKETTSKVQLNGGLASQPELRAELCNKYLGEHRTNQHSKSCVSPSEFLSIIGRGSALEKADY